MKKFVSVVLAIIMVGLVVLLCINISIKSMAAKTVSNAVVANETTDQIQQVITENFPNVTDDQIQQIQEVISTSSSINSFTDDLLNQITEATLNGEQVDTASIMNQLSQVFVDNVDQIEQVIDQDITDEQIQIVQERLTDQNGALQTKINEVVDSVQSGSTSTTEFLQTYQTVSSMAVRIGCIIGIIVCIVLIGLLNRSLYDWSIYAGVAAIVSAIIIGLFAPLVVNAIEFTIGLRVLNMSIDIPVSMLRVEGIVLGVIGIILIIAYIILSRKFPKYERSYY
ncbi:hypothetical protein B5E92_01535 [Erysipelatoclostridium sp. An15]|uniref:hypothetical protein n=1 Tax=Erysipelatoclostridium sp. An15 TaxID=1965566 RepID=UPI000B39AAE3|nr:hypothetical protein [Erysipelatoclostridium sp. An15]OUQ09090.1 hypothetical protein B5E92_01535 [Erysipelatoclostridium sp. An15]